MTALPARRSILAGDFLQPFQFAEQIMAMPARAPHRPWTEEDFYTARDAAPPGERWELVDGEVLVTPTPHWMHQRIIGRLFELITPYVRLDGLGETFLSNGAPHVRRKALTAQGTGTSQGTGTAQGTDGARH